MLPIKGADIKNIIPKLNTVCPIENRSILVFIQSVGNMLDILYLNTNFFINSSLQ